MTSPSLQTVNSPIPTPSVSSAPVMVRAFENQDSERWDRFVLEHPKETFYQVFLVRRKSPPIFSPANHKFEDATKDWSHLPLWLANRLGQRVVCWIP